MKTTVRLLFAVAIAGALGPGGSAQPATPPAPPPPTTAAPAPDRATPPAETPRAAAAPAEVPAAATTAAEPAESEPALRRLDEPEATPRPSRKRRGSERPGEPPPFGDHHVRTGREMREAVSIMGSTTVDGNVTQDAVSVLGSTTVNRDATVGGAAVAVLGKLDVQGKVAREAVSVLGGVNIDGEVGGEAVSVLGNMRLGPEAVVKGDIVVIGGTLTKEPGAYVGGDEVKLTVFGGLGEMEWLSTWFKRCLLLGRPLAFGANLGWAWALALAFLAFYAFLALLFPKAMDRCADTLDTRPGFSILAAVLAVLLTPVVFVLLFFTIVGALLVPFLIVAMIAASLFGKAVMLAWLGRRITALAGTPVPTVIAVLIGGVLVLGLYVIPFFGLLLFKLLGWLGFGVVVYTIILWMKRDRPARPGTTGPGLPVGPVTPVAPAAPGMPVVSGMTAAPGVGVVSGTPPPAAVPAATMMQSASFQGPVAAPAAVAAPAHFESTIAGVPTEAGTRQPSAGAFPAGEAPAGGVASGYVASTDSYEGAPLPPPPPAAPPLAATATAATGAPPPPPPFVPIAPASGAHGMPAPSALIALPRASLMIRLGALFLDVLLVALIVGFLTDLLPRWMHIRSGPPGLLPLLAIYGAILWKMKGTTIGGIICGLKVVRVDGRELDWPTAIVRALGCFLSLVVAGLGFIWIAIDDEKQSWHDKIAGTIVVRMPKGVSLV